MSKIDDLKKLRTITENNQLEADYEIENKANLVKYAIDEDERNNLNSSYMNHTRESKKTHSRLEIEALDKTPLISNEENQQDSQANKSNTDMQKHNKIFMTEHFTKFDNKDLHSFHDLIVPGSKNAKLCIIHDPFNKSLRVTEIADHFKFYEPTPVIVLIGANTKRKGKLLAGISRAALNTGAIIIDSGLQTGIENFCIRRNLNLIGVAPESMIEYPKPNPEPFSTKMLTGGHSHFVLLKGKELTWGHETKFKVNLAERISYGRKGFPYKSKVVGVLFGNITSCEEELLMFKERNWPIILIEDSNMSQVIKSIRNKEDIPEETSENVIRIGNYNKIIEINEEDSEELASAVHLCLTISF